MTDYLVDPVVGKTTIKIDPSTQSATTLIKPMSISKYKLSKYKT